jgi:hypothetical protein
VDSDAHSKRSFARSATQLGEHGNLNLALFPAGFFDCPLDARCVLVRYPIRTTLRTDDRGYVADYDNSETELGGECGRTGLPSATTNGALINSFVCHLFIGILVLKSPSKCSPSGSYTVMMKTDSGLRLTEATT